MPDTADERLRRLEPLVGTWALSGFGSSEPVGRTTFEWALGGAFLLQRSEVDVEGAPDALSIIAPDRDGDGYTQHYFDSRGVVRVYRMTFDGSRWELLRDEPDFTPLGFSQRFVGTLSDDGQSIEGAWEKTPPGGGAFELDFEIRYVRVA